MSVRNSGAAQAEYEQTLKAGTFLVVDDFDSMRKVTMNQLRHLGAQKILEAGNGSEALKIIERQPVSIVLSDWNMPVMDGLELLTRLRGHSTYHALPFMMITAEAARERVEMAIATGVSELLVKPYTAGLLAERVQRALRWQPRRAAVDIGAVGGGAATATAAHTVIRPRTAADMATILVVDDTAENLTLLSGLFKDSYRVKIAHNGEKALHICQTDFPPDLVLLDVMMPGMDGFEVAQALRAHPSSEHIPIIFVTALNDEASRIRGMELGAVDFVTKPIDPEMLRIRVSNFIRYVDLHRGLQADYDKMMEVARLKEEVEHIARHDIKGPLAGMLGLAQGLIDDARLPADLADQVRMIEESAASALNLINLSAEIYRIESGTFELHAAEVPIAKLLHRLIEQHKRIFSEKSLVIQMAKPRAYDFDELVVKGDATLCYSALQNLLKNACEAAPNGSEIEVTLALEDQRIAVTIRNAGAVPKGVRDRFFEKFATEGKRGGTGLGTYSAKLLIEAQEGTIEMQTSDADNHTVVTLSLPEWL